MQRIVKSACFVGAFCLLMSFGATIAWGQTADMKIEITDAPDPVEMNGILTFTVEIENKGPNTAQDVTFTVSAPTSILFGSFDAMPVGSLTCTQSTNQLDCQLGDVSSDSALDTIYLTIKATPTQIGQFITNVAVQSTTSDSDNTNNNDTSTVHVIEATTGGGGGGGMPPITDSDGDGIVDADDNCPGAVNAGQEDGDADGFGDVCDNCPTVANASQADDDGNGVGNACEPEMPTDPDNPTPPDITDDGSGQDTPGDCSAGDPDDDGDGLCASADNCPNVANESQEDFDGDGQGDACDDDIDGDGIANASDDCANSELGSNVDGAGCEVVEDTTDAPNCGCATTGGTAAFSPFAFMWLTVMGLLKRSATWTIRRRW